MRNSTKTLEFSLILIVHFANHILSHTLPILILYARDDISIDYTATGILTSTLIVTMTVFSAIVGLYSDHSYRIRYMFMYGGTAIMASGWYFLSISSTFNQLIIIFALIGLGAAGFHIPAMAVITDLYEGSMGKALSVNMITGMFGTAITPLIFPFLVKLSGGWQGASKIIFYYGMITLAITTIFSLYFGIFSIKYDATIDKQLNGTKGMTGLAFLLSPIIVLPVAFISIRAAIFRISSIFTSLVYEDYLTLSKEKSAQITALVLGLATLFIVLGGVISDKYKPRTAILISSVATMLSAVFLMYQLDFSNLLGFSFFYFALNASYYIGSPAASSMLANRVKPEERGRMFGALFSIGQFFSMGVPVLFGYLKEEKGIVSAFVLILILTIIALFLGVYIFFQDKRHLEQ